MSCVDDYPERAGCAPCIPTDKLEKAYNTYLCVTTAEVSRVVEFYLIYAYSGS